MSPFLKKPRSPPFCAAGSELSCLASAAKSAPLFSSAMIVFAWSSVGTRIWAAWTSSSPGLPAMSRA
ncbi:MAG: hypothetical protein WDN49_20495 [Acetobacteraceae bacterium]